jgi:hypothetical protein
MPVYGAFWSAIVSTFYLQLDETPVKVLKPGKLGIYGLILLLMLKKDW